MTKIKILRTQIATDLQIISKDYNAGLYDTSGLLKDLETITKKVLQLEAYEDAINDIENNEPEQRSERDYEAHCEKCGDEVKGEDDAICQNCV